MGPIRVLFLCTGNSARSIIAQALLSHLGGAEFEVHSAGTHPKGINPLTEKVLAQEGLSVAGLSSTSVDEYVDQPFDYVVTVCDQAAEACPVFPGAARRIHWSFADPAAVEGDEAVRLATFRETLRGMRARIESFIPVARHAATQA